jgi:hypothetical protein
VVSTPIPVRLAQVQAPVAPRVHDAAAPPAPPAVAAPPPAAPAPPSPAAPAITQPTAVPARAPPIVAVHTPVPAAGARDWIVATAVAAGLVLLIVAAFASRARLLRDLEARWSQ